MSDSIDLIATCAFGLEAVVRRELSDLGYVGKVISPGRILFSAPPEAICRANLWLRSADRVLIRLATFEAADFDALFDQTRDLSWSQWLPQDACFPVSAKSHDSQLESVPAIQRTVKKAAVLGMQREFGTEVLDESGAQYKIEASLIKDVATLTIDTTGPGLHKRHYCDRPALVLVKETLAAALVQLSFWNRDRPMVDPFCGSGTIVIEAAMIGRRIAPGLGRSFSAQQWPTLSPAMWENAIEEAMQLQLPDLEGRIIGTDVDGRSLAAARESAVRAGVEGSVHFQTKSFGALSSNKQYGCVITYTPYEMGGRRNPEQDALYRSIPLVLRRLTTWSHYVLTPHPRFEQIVGRDADRRRKLYNARTECTYYQFHGPKRPRDAAATRAAEADSPDAAETEGSIQNPPTESVGPMPAAVGVPAARPKPTIAPAFGHLDAKAHEQAALFRTRLTKRARHLRRLPTRQGVTCFRLYERDIPEIPLVVDRYGDHLHINEYERPHDRDPAQHANWLDLMAKTAGETLEIPKGQTFLKRRLRQSGSSQHEHVASDHYETEVTEAGLRFIVNLSDYVDTGLFLDHRLTRGMVRAEAEGKSMLNLFAYTGSFSVYAAAGGAARTTTVDWSNTYLDWARRNMALNGFDGLEHKYHRESALDFLANQPLQPAYDLAVVDPPTFSNSKRTDDVWDVQQGYVDLINAVLPRMQPGGVIYFSSNFRRLKFDPEAIDADEIREISAQTVPPEYRNRRIHRCWRIVKPK
ncbi:Ribosomal RNA large subunit methyltransferase K/L [Rosistilla carotiformis]|uniref:Ribosomal RNA large subunit methyltransferase K/L n=1 Tax=Rosistilla carotiformis TaxID=2528017 RepID=A0A518JW35_9BACT|nr:bifunctional 23S rRNA (guanine(2069)-N(7))-methyltransferase RlmK/23S rRNA (guanine(2445)-N(2))-methyltransferase RlmL [Rosistilla carotiformis]QDV69756.1 Ribosomal RNA large subunit methyltransferase K/L [Rosistilla carotiformis]